MNVVKKYLGWTEELIKNDMLENSFPFAVMMEMWEHDMNIGTLIRNANAFRARQVFYLAHRKKYDRRGTVGTHHYVELIHLRHFDELNELKNKYTFVGVDNIPGSIPMESFQWPENALMIFGSETAGLSEEIQSYCEHVVSIKQHGTVPSLNCGTASGIAMYDWHMKK